jgi:hypothetical protein
LKAQEVLFEASIIARHIISFGSQAAQPARSVSIASSSTRRSRVGMRTSRDCRDSWNSRPRTRAPWRNPGGTARRPHRGGPQTHFPEAPKAGGGAQGPLREVFLQAQGLRGVP